jgi:hypothetical protein
MPPKKPEPSSSLGWELAFFLLVLYFFYMIYLQADYYLGVWGYGSASVLWSRIEYYFIAHVYKFIKAIGFVVSLGAIWFIYYSFRNLNKVIHEESAVFGKVAKVSAILEPEEPPQGNPKWEKVVEHANSTNSAEWRLGIIEADIMLDDLLKAAGYHGDSLGERLKAVEKSDFLTLDNAWEAHKIRNQIAHQGADFSLSEREVRRVITLYESVFKEFKVI